MAQGSFEIPLSVAAPWSLYHTCVEFGHIVIVPQWIDPTGLSDTAIKNLARYSGVLLDKELNDDTITLRGASIHWHLGDDDNAGPAREGTQSFSSSSLTSVVSNALTDTGLTSGTITTTGLGSYTGTHYFASPAEILRTACLALGAEYRVNPDGTVDAGPKNAVYNTDFEDISVFVVRRGFGTDSIFKSVPVQSMRSRLDATNYVTRIIIAADTNNDGSLVEVESLTRSPSDNYKNFGGGNLKRVFVSTMGVSQAIALATYVTSELAQRSKEQRQDISTEHYEIANGSLQVGDAFFAYDPPAFTDNTNPQYFRGQTIFPIATRLLAADWPVRQGMGVFYRDSAGVYTDLTRFVAWEGESDSLL